MKKKMFSLVLCLVFIVGTVSAKDPDYMYSTCPICHITSHVLQPYATKHNGAAHIKDAWQSVVSWWNSL